MSKAIQTKHIGYTSCPECGAPFSEFGRETDHFSMPRKIRVHCNGGQWEYIVFTCGRKDQFTPNFERIETLRKCENNPTAKAEALARTKALDSVVNFVLALDVDKKYREELVGKIDYNKVLAMQREESLRRDREADLWHINDFENVSAYEDEIGDPDDDS